MAEAFQHFSAESTKMEPLLRSTQALKQEAEELGYQGKEIAEYVKKEQALDREKRAAWRDTQKMQAQADLEFSKIQAEAEEKEKKRAEEIRKAELQVKDKKRADEIHEAEMQVQADAEEKKGLTRSRFRLPRQRQPKNKLR